MLDFPPDNDAVSVRPGVHRIAAGATSGLTVSAFRDPSGHRFIGTGRSEKARVQSAASQHTRVGTAGIDALDHPYENLS